MPAIPTAPFFENWIKTALAWPYSYAPGPLASIVAGVARAADVVLGDLAWLINQFSPITCEPEYVNRFGAARGLVRHHRETPNMWRKRVCAALAWHKLAGKTLGMPQILAHFGYTGGIMINRAAEGQPEKWAHFRVDLLTTNGYPMAEADWDIVRWILQETKPAKSILESITIVLQPKAKVCCLAAYICGEVVTILPWQPAAVTPQKATNFILTGNQSVEYAQITPQRI